MRAIHEQGGWRAFFRGNGTNVIKIAPESAFKFFAYDKIKGIICSSADKPTTIERMMSGSLAGLTAQAVSSIIIYVFIDIFFPLFDMCLLNISFKLKLQDENAKNEQKSWLNYI